MTALRSDNPGLVEVQVGSAVSAPGNGGAASQTAQPPPAAAAAAAAAPTGTSQQQRQLNCELCSRPLTSEHLGFKHGGTKAKRFCPFQNPNVPQQPLDASAPEDDIVAQAKQCAADGIPRRCWPRVLLTKFKSAERQAKRQTAKAAAATPATAAVPAEVCELCSRPLTSVHLGFKHGGTRAKRFCPFQNANVPQQPLDASASDDDILAQAQQCTAARISLRCWPDVLLTKFRSAEQRVRRQAAKAAEAAEAASGTDGSSTDGGSMDIDADAKSE